MVTLLHTAKEMLVGGETTDYVHVDALVAGRPVAAQDEQIAAAINTLTKRAQDFSSNADFWKQLLAMFEQTRIAASEKRWITAQQTLIEATVLVNRAIASESQRGARIRLAIAPLGWFIALYFFQMFMHWLSNTTTWVYIITPEYFQYLWLGMLGGTTIVLWGIVKHGTEMTFDRAYIIWYIFKPALGAIMGIVVVLFVQAGFFTMQGNLEIKNTAPLLVLAFIGGFSERFFIQVIDRVVTTILGGEKAPKSEQAPPVRPVLRAAESPTKPPTASGKGKRSADDREKEK